MGGNAVSIRYDVRMRIRICCILRHFSRRWRDTYKRRLTCLSGDIHQVLPGSGKTILWKAVEELGIVQGSQLRIRMVAYDKPVERYDIVVFGNSLGSVSAALQAARDNANASVLLIETTDCWEDGNNAGSFCDDNASASLMTDTPDYYAKDCLIFRRELNKPQDAPGLGFGGTGHAGSAVFLFDPRTGNWPLGSDV